MSDALTFYDNSFPKRIYDFLKPNKRLVQAITFVLSKLDANARNILDIGCGLGWSSFEFSRNTNAKIEAIDLSPNLIEFAKGIFGNGYANYAVKNVNDGFEKTQKFSVIVMIDVFEHIEKENRDAFTNSLKNLVDETFQIFITCPTVDHQNYLKQNDPEGLQPVDEDVTQGDIYQLAKSLNARLDYFEIKDIFRKGDYFHSMISNYDIQSTPQFSLLNKKERVEKLVNFKRNVLGKKITLRDKLWFMRPERGYDLISGSFKSKKIKGF